MFGGYCKSFGMVHSLFQNRVVTIFSNLLMKLSPGNFNDLPLVRERICWLMS